MSEEEKEAIEKFKNFIYTYQEVIEDEYSDYEEKESAKEYQEVSEKLLKLISKQQKEIENLKSRKYILNAETNEIKEIPISDNYISKDKIKEKIDLIDKEYAEIIEKNKNDLYLVNINAQRHSAMQLILEELLGETND